MCHVRVCIQKVVSLYVLGLVCGYMCVGWVWRGLWHWVLSLLPDSEVSVSEPWPHPWHCVRPSLVCGQGY